MASSLEGNKILASILTAGVIAMSSGLIAGLIYYPETLSENAFPIAVEVADATSGDDAGSGEESALALLASADSAAGAKQAKKCTSCHTFEEGGADKIGPNLWDLVNQPIANNAGFAYSDALSTKSGETWTFENLDAFITNPKGWAPGTKMSFAGIKKTSQRADLLLYMRDQSGNPAPLPEAPAADEAVADESAAAESEGAAPEDGQTAEAAPADEAAPAAEDSIMALLATADVAKGEKQAKKCKSCHSFEEGGADKVGPNLWDVVNQPIANNEGYKYSDALTSKSGETWSYENLDGYLSNPKGWAPGTKMSFAGVKKLQQRADLVAYLRSLSGNPAPLP